MPKRRPAPREATAHHEAGHAVAGWVLGWEINSISIRGSTGYHGCTDFDEPRQPKRGQYQRGVTWYRLEDAFELRYGEAVLPDLLARVYAGVVAERILHEKRGVSPRSVRLGLDIRQARELVRRFDRERRDTLLQTAEIHARDILSDGTMWDAVEHVTQALLEEEVLPQARVHQLLGHLDQIEQTVWKRHHVPGT